MTIRHEIETLSFVFLASLVVTVAIGYMHKPNFSHFHIATPVTSLLPSQDPTPTPVPSVNTVSQTSSDGKQKLTIKEVNTQGLKNYTVTITDVEKNTTTSLFTQNATSSSLLVPFNAFSPDDTYVFLEQKAEGKSHYLVFQTSTEPFAGGNTYIDATSAFEGYTSSYGHPQATGWGDNNLLITNAIGSDGHPASFWMVIPTGGFIPLSNYFP